MSYSKTDISNQVNEPLAAYLTHNQAKQGFGLFGNVFNNASSASDFDIIKLTRQGFSKKVLMSLAQKISLTLQEFAHIMHISERTLQRYEDDTIVKTEYAEKAVELARLYTRGEEVFGSMEGFKTWMKSPLLAFGGETPLSLLDTSIGFSIILNEIGRIEQGVFA